MNDARWARVESCRACSEFIAPFYCDLDDHRIMCDEGIDSDCPLLHLRDIPEVKGLVKASKEILSSPFKVDLTRGFVEIRVSIKHNNDLGNAIKPFEEKE